MSQYEVSPKFVGIMLGAVAALALGNIALSEYDKKKERDLKDKKLENEKIYFSKLTSDQVQEIELRKIQLEHEKVELKKSETELKKTIENFKKDIQSEIQRTTNDNIERDMRRTFDDWSAKYEDRLDKKIDRVVNRIDDLSDKYGGVKATGSSAPTISVVNAPNN